MTLRDRLNRRINASIEFRMAEQARGMTAEVSTLRDLLLQVDHTIRELADRTGELDKRIAEVGQRLDEVRGESSWTANELARLAPQAAAFEARLERQARPIVLTGAVEDLPEARTLVEVVREEHARVRTRLSLVSAYEERLRRLEQREAERSPSS